MGSLLFKAILGKHFKVINSEKYDHPHLILPGIEAYMSIGSTKNIGSFSNDLKINSIEAAIDYYEEYIAPYTTD